MVAIWTGVGELTLNTDHSWIPVYLISLIVMCLAPNVDSRDLPLSSEIYNSKTHFFHLETAPLHMRDTKLHWWSEIRTICSLPLLCLIRRPRPYYRVEEWQVRLLSILLAKLVSHWSMYDNTWWRRPQESTVSGRWPPPCSGEWLSDIAPQWAKMIL